MVVWGFGVLVLLAVLTAVIGHFLKTPNFASRSGSAVNQSEDEEWRERLHRITTEAGERCTAVTTVFNQGRDANDDSYWNIRCRDGNSYAIRLRTGGDTRVMSCDLLRKVARVNCFEKFASPK